MEAPELADALRACLPDLARETVEAIGREVPGYARSLDGPWGRTLRDGVEGALARFLDELEGGRAREPSAEGLYAGLGRGELRAGRSLDALLSAYRLGARLAWERFCAVGTAAGHDPARMYALAGAIFTYIDAISAESAAAYAEAQSERAGERARRRRALGRGLAGTAATREELEALARAAAWTLPAQVAALVVAGEPDPGRLASRLGHDVIAAAGEEGEVIAWVPDPDAPGRRTELVAALVGERAVLGPTVGVDAGAASLRRARLAHAAVAAGHLAADGLLVADEHLLGLVLHGAAAPEALALADALLAPVDALAAGARARSLATLRAWLDQPGQIQRIGGVLGVHPQTVRYRLAGLRELLGEQALEDPDHRFALAVAVRARTGAG